MLSKATRRYSLALYEAAVSEKKLNKVAEDSVNLIYLINSNRDLYLFFSSPVIREDKKIQVVENLFDKKINKLTIDFLKLIIVNNRGALVTEIFNGFLDLKNDAEGKVKAEVITAVKIDEKEKKKLKEKLDGFTGMNSIPEFRVDNELVGGFTIQVKDVVIDASIKRQLENLRNRFKGINIKQF
jgi:F-type H+-transporting ATPase subunit delta